MLFLAILFMPFQQNPGINSSQCFPEPPWESTGTQVCRQWAGKAHLKDIGSRAQLGSTSQILSGRWRGQRDFCIIHPKDLSSGICKCLSKVNKEKRFAWDEAQ